VTQSQHYILATAGHVDHGKSALVRALTGTDPDRLPEEKARGITIDLGFASLQLNDGEKKYELGIIDVPGHEDFVKNMVAGVGSIDVVMLVVAADDGWMPQTEEHLQILGYLGVSHGVVALTKSDLIAKEKIPIAIAEVRQQLQGTSLADAPIVPVSAVSGDGLTELKAALVHVLSQTPPPRVIQKPRLPVDRVFVLKGVGTVVTGTLSGGKLERGQTVIVQPSGVAARIRMIQTHNKEVATGLPGSRVALNLPDLDHSTIHRGDILTIPSLGNATKTVDVLLEQSPRASLRPLKSGTKVKLHHGAAAVAARIRLGGSIAQLALEKPIFSLVGDRFVIRDWSEQHTLAGGIVLDVAGRRFNDPKQRKFIEMRAQSLDDPGNLILSQLSRDGWVNRSSLLMQSRFSAAGIERAVIRSIESGAAIEIQTIIAEKQLWSDIRRITIETIDEHHKQHPEQPGLPLTDLRQTLRKKIGDATVFEALIADICASGFIRSGALVRRASHQPALPARLRAAGEKLRAILTKHPFDPPSRNELAGDDPSQQALKFLVLNHEVIELGPTVVLGAAGYETAIQKIREHLRTHSGATVSELKELLKSSRRIVVPLLERLDREGVTRRQGELRVLR
jgi:selenocysteine-specific elongation factor